MQHATAKAAVDARCVSLVGTNLELNLEAGAEADVDCLLTAVQFVCADGGRSINEATAPVAASTVSGDLSLLLKKAGSKRFSLGPARLTSIDNHRLSTLPTRASMIACQESEDWILPSNLTLGHFHQPALLVTFYHALLSHAAANQAIESVLAMAREGRIFTGYTADSRGRWHASTLTLFIDADTSSLCWCPFGTIKQTHENQRITFQKLSEIYLGKQSAALRCVLAAGANPIRCLSIVAGERGIDIEARNERTMLGFLFAIFVSLQRQGKTFVPGTAKHRVRVVAMPKPSTAPPPPPPKPVQANTGIEVEVVQLMEDGRTIRLVPCKLIHSQQSGSLEAFSVNPPRSIVASIALNTIRDIYCGKGTRLFSHESNVNIKDDRCLAFVAKQTAAMELVLKDRNAVNSLVDAAMKSLTSAGKTVFDSPPPPLPPRKANKENNASSSNTNNRRLSVMASASATHSNALSAAIKASAAQLRVSIMNNTASSEQATQSQFRCSWSDKSGSAIARMAVESSRFLFASAETTRFEIKFTDIAEARAGRSNANRATV